MRLPIPKDPEPWVAEHLGHLVRDAGASASIRGGQTAADAALAAFDVTGYAARRNEVWPAQRRGASRLSPYIRHGLLQLRRVWDAVDGPQRDVAKFRDELLWQEYARHWYARLGRRTASEFRANYPQRPPQDPWPSSMACLSLVLGELHREGWLVNQSRMWLASHWVVRGRYHWRAGEEEFFAHLLDGSRAANRLGWQWTAGFATGRPYGFSRFQVRKRAPGLCDGCALRRACPIEHWPDEPDIRRVPAPDPPPVPSDPVGTGEQPDAVWLTAESLGDDDPALAAWPGLPAVFVFDEPLLARLRLSGKRLVFLAECLADLARRRPLRVLIGDPTTELRGLALAATAAPVPGWRARAARLHLADVRPWPWLVPHRGQPVTSFTAWRRASPPLGEGHS